MQKTQDVGPGGLPKKVTAKFEGKTIEGHLRGAECPAWFIKAIDRGGSGAIQGKMRHYYARHAL